MNTKHMLLKQENQSSHKMKIEVYKQLKINRKKDKTNQNYKNNSKIEEILVDKCSK